MLFITERFKRVKVEAADVIADTVLLYYTEEIINGTAGMRTGLKKCSLLFTDDVFIH